MPLLHLLTSSTTITLTTRSLLTTRVLLPRQLTRLYPSRLLIRNMSEFKLKGLSSLDLKDGELREVEVEGIEEGKILLSKTGGKVSATGSKCTHYGAPLVKGILNSKGLVTCPWHASYSSHTSWSCTLTFVTGRLVIQILWFMSFNSCWISLRNLIAYPRTVANYVQLASTYHLVM